jgi:hypothetical protein
VYVHNPAATITSTAAAYTTRNYTIAPADAWNELVEVQGFAAPVWQDASGNSLGTPFMTTSQTSGTVTIALPQATFGTPGSGWSFAVVLTGQDGFSSDQARAFTATPGPDTFGVCAVGGTSPICSVDLATVPKAMDVITPAGVSQDTELNPTLGRHRARALGDERLAGLHDELAGYPGGTGDTLAPGDGVVLPLRYRYGDQELAMFSISAAVGTATDVTVEELTIESFYPADAATAAALRQAGRPRPAEGASTTVRL